MPRSSKAHQQFGSRKPSPAQPTEGAEEACGTRKSSNVATGNSSSIDHRLTRVFSSSLAAAAASIYHRLSSARPAPSPRRREPEVKLSRIRRRRTNPRPWPGSRPSFTPASTEARRLGSSSLVLFLPSTGLNWRGVGRGDPSRLISIAGCITLTFSCTSGA